MAIDKTQPADSVRLSDLPSYIRETREALDLRSIDVITGIPYESNLEDGDAVYLDSVAQVFRRSLAMDASRGKFHGIFDSTEQCVRIMGKYSYDGWQFQIGQTVYVSASELGDLTGTNTGLVAGVAIGIDTVLIASSIMSVIDAVVDEVAAARLGKLTLGLLTKELNDNLAGVLAEVQAARSGKVSLSARLADLLTAEDLVNDALDLRLDQVEKAIQDCLGNYPTLASLLAAHQGVFNATASEVAAARGEKLTLAERLTAIVGMFDEVIQARSGFSSLLAHLQGLASSISSGNAEVVDARAGQASLNARLNGINDNFQEVVEARGAFSSLAGHFTDLESDLNSVVEEVLRARGVAQTLATRLAVSLNEDGTLKTTVTPVLWFNETGTIEKVDGNSFTILSDLSSVYVTNRALEINGGNYCYVVSSSYSGVSGKTTVVFSGAAVSAAITTVAYSFHPNVLPLQSHGNLSGILGADSGSSDSVKNKHVSNAQVKALVDADTAMGVTLSGLATSMGEAQGDITALETLTASTAGTVASQGTRLTAAEAELVSLDSRLDVAEGDIGTVETNLGVVQTSLGNKVVFDFSAAEGKSAAFTAADKGVYRITAGGFIITPPSNPVANQTWFALSPECDLKASPLTFDCSGQKFKGVADDLVIDASVNLIFIFKGATYGWDMI